MLLERGLWPPIASDEHAQRCKLCRRILLSRAARFSSGLTSRERAGSDQVCPSCQISPRLPSCMPPCLPCVWSHISWESFPWPLLRHTPARLRAAETHLEGVLQADLRGNRANLPVAVDVAAALARVLDDHSHHACHAALVAFEVARQEVP